jgi:hypothetical protein
MLQHAQQLIVPSLSPISGGIFFKCGADGGDPPKLVVIAKEKESQLLAAEAYWLSLIDKSKEYLGQVSSFGGP